MAQSRDSGYTYLGTKTTDLSRDFLNIAKECGVDVSVTALRSAVTLDSELVFLATNKTAIQVWPGQPESEDELPFHVRVKGFIGMSLDIFHQRGHQPRCLVYPDNAFLVCEATVTRVAAQTAMSISNGRHRARFTMQICSAVM